MLTASQAYRDSFSLNCKGPAALCGRADCARRIEFFGTDNDCTPARLRDLNHELGLRQARRPLFSVHFKARQRVLDRDKQVYQDNRSLLRAAIT